MPLLAKLQGFECGFAAHVRAHLGSIVWLIIPIIFLTGTNLAYWRDHDEMRLLLRLHCGGALIRYFQSCLQGMMCGYNVAVHDQMIAYMTPYYTMAWWQAFALPKWLGGEATGFTPTGSIASDMHERDEVRRAPVLQRLRHILFNCGAWFHVLTVLLIAVCAGIRIRGVLQLHTSMSSRQLFIDLLQKVAWPTNPWFLYIVSFLAPIRYALFPPDVPPRNSFFKKADGSGVRYLTDEAKARCTGGYYGSSGVGFVHINTLFTVYVAVMFVASWWI